MPARLSRGFSMVELLVGTAVGLVVVAAAGSVVAAHHDAARRVQLEARLTQDLRSTSELIARDLRRAGHWSAAASGVRGGDAAVVPNPHVDIVPATAASAVVALSFSTGTGEAATVDDAERFGFRLRNGAIEIQLGARNWQSLSDPSTVVVTALSVVPRLDEIDLSTFCDAPCAAGSTTCPPRQQIRSFAVTVAGRSPADAQVARVVRSGVRVRNDVVVGGCDA